jgi:hypothetical protein
MIATWVRIDDQPSKIGIGINPGMLRIMATTLGGNQYRLNLGDIAHPTSV